MPTTTNPGYPATTALFLSPGYVSSLGLTFRNRKEGPDFMALWRGVFFPSLQVSYLFILICNFNFILILTPQAGGLRGAQPPFNEGLV